MPHVPLTERYHCHVGCPVQVCCNARHPYNFLPLTGVFPHVKNVISLPSGVHVVAVSAIGTNRASSVAMVKFNVAGKDTAGVCRHENVNCFRSHPDLVANCSGAVHGRNLYITCDANYPIQFATCSVDQRQPQQCQSAAEL